MDNWHITPRLSIRYGMRYDLMPHAWERNNRVASFDPTQYQKALAPVLDPETGAFCTAVTANCPVVSPGLRTYQGAKFYLNGVTIARIPSEENLLCGALSENVHGLHRFRTTN